jgi:hypothetical protein
MMKLIFAAAGIVAVALVISMAPDIRRYARIRSM